MGAEALNKVGVGYFLEAETEVSILVDALDKELLKGLARVFLPEVLHRVGCALWKDELRSDLRPKLALVSLNVFLVRDDLVKLDTLNDSVFLLFGDVKLPSPIIIVLSKEEVLRIEALSLYDALCDPL